MVETESIDCPYCGRVDTHPWANENGYTAVKCVFCGFVYVNPRPTLNSIDKAVKLGVHRREVGALNVAGKYHRSKIRKFRTRLREIYPAKELFHKQIKWLDIDTSFGEFLLAIQQLTDSHSIIRGIKPCKPKFEKAKEMGLVVYEDLEEIDDRYNIISAINVFSHLSDPIAFVADLKDRLTQNGEILLVTGNGGDIPASKYPGDYYFPDHLVFAGEEHVIGILERADFD